MDVALFVVAAAVDADVAGVELSEVVVEDVGDVEEAAVGEEVDDEPAAEPPELPETAA